MEHSAFDAQVNQAEPETVVVHVQLRPRRGATRKCLAALASLAAEHAEVAFAVTGLSKDDRVVRVTVGVDLGPRTAVAKFSPQAQAAYAFVSAMFTSLYDHMPVYTAEPSRAERAAAAVLMEQAAGGVLAADALEGLPATASPVPSPRMPAPGERIPA
jgi:predicted alpha/beta hydrolase family esterase